MLKEEKKILTYEQAVQRIHEAKEKGLKVILAQGIFDIVHAGHIEYLRMAKEKGNLLFVGTEQDNTVRLNKGENRPFNSLEERLYLLSELESVDFVFPYSNLVQYSESSEAYIQRYKELNPDSVAFSSWDPNLDLKKRNAASAGIEIVLTHERKRKSTTNLLRLIGYEA